MKVPSMNAARTELWLFPDGLNPDGVTLEVVEERQQLSKDGKMNIPVLKCTGRVDDFVGDVIISMWKLRISDETKKNLGDDTALWIKKVITVKPSEDKKFLIV
jgi:hypothetical protein